MFCCHCILNCVSCLCSYLFTFTTHEIILQTCIFALSFSYQLVTFKAKGRILNRVAASLIPSGWVRAWRESEDFLFVFLVTERELGFCVTNVSVICSQHTVWRWSSTWRLEGWPRCIRTRSTVCRNMNLQVTTICCNFKCAVLDICVSILVWNSVWLSPPEWAYSL